MAEFRRENPPNRNFLIATEFACENFQIIPYDVATSFSWSTYALGKKTNPGENPGGAPVWPCQSDTEWLPDLGSHLHVGSKLTLVKPKSDSSCKCWVWQTVKNINGRFLLLEGCRARGPLQKGQMGACGVERKPGVMNQVQPSTVPTELPWKT